MPASRTDAFWKLWRSLPRTNGMPTLSEFLSHPNPATQPWTIIVDIVPDAFPIRLFGTGMVSMIGKDYTGADYLRAVREELRPKMYERDTTCVRVPCGLQHRVQGRTSQGRGIISDICIAPVSRAGGQYSLVRCSSITESMTADDLPLAITKFFEATWVDLGAGIPDHPPWTETA